MRAKTFLLFGPIRDRPGLTAPVRAQQQKPLEVYFIDVEGGQSTLFVSPSGQSLLVDTGWAGGRDAGRIANVAKLAGVGQIDYLVLTHYHADHAGGVVELAGLIPIKNFVDQRASRRRNSQCAAKLCKPILTVRGKGKHIQVRPGRSRFLFRDLNVQVISSAAETIAKSPLPASGHGESPMREFCQPKDEVADPLISGENKQSVGNGDLAWQISRGRFWRSYLEQASTILACPNNPIGALDRRIHHFCIMDKISPAIRF